MSQAPELWEHGTESGRQVVTLGVAVMLSVVAVQHLTLGRLGLFFDLCFVTVCLALALRVRRESFYAVGLLPPLLMLGLLVLLALTAPGTVARPGDGVVQAVVAGFAHHAAGLAAGYAAALGALFWRRREFLADLYPDPAGQSSKREVSPAPTRMTSG